MASKFSDKINDISLWTSVYTKVRTPKVSFCLKRKEENFIALDLKETKTLAENLHAASASSAPYRFVISTKGAIEKSLVPLEDIDSKDRSGKFALFVVFTGSDKDPTRRVIALIEFTAGELELLAEKMNLVLESMLAIRGELDRASIRDLKKVVDKVDTDLQRFFNNFHIDIVTLSLSVMFLVAFFMIGKWLL